MGIKHIEDLTYNEFINAIGFAWKATEKVDGSSVEFGFDDKLQYYLEYGKQRYYSVDEIPDEAWATTYKLAFLVGQLVLTRVKEHYSVGTNFYVRAELVFSHRPNTIYYAIPDTIIILSAGRKGSEEKTSLEIFSNITDINNGIAISYNGLISRDGKTVETELMGTTVHIAVNTDYNIISKMLHPRRCVFHGRIYDWLLSKSSVEGFTVGDIIRWPMNRRPPNIPSDQWSLEKKEFQEVRDSYRAELDILRMKLKEEIIEIMETVGSTYSARFMEGIVVNTDSPFKVVDKKNFTRINLYLHRMKYLLLGSAFYKKKGLLQIYKDHPKEVKLRQMDRLLNWYLRHHTKMLKYEVIGSSGTIFGYMDQVHQRTLNMFADTRKRIEDGR